MVLATWLRYGNNSEHYVFVTIPDSEFQNTVFDLIFLTLNTVR